LINRFEEFINFFAGKAYITISWYVGEWTRFAGQGLKRNPVAVTGGTDARRWCCKRWPGEESPAKVC